MGYEIMLVDGPRRGSELCVSPVEGFAPGVISVPILRELGVDVPGYYRLTPAVNASGRLVYEWAGRSDWA